MSHRVALLFKDGATRFITCEDNETIAEASYRQKINIPLDCNDGACGFCKSFCENGTYDMPEYDYIEDALSPDEAKEGYVLTCKMRPTSDCNIQIDSTLKDSKTSNSEFEAKIIEIDIYKNIITFALEAQSEFFFLPGQYINIKIPNSDVYRSYSCSSSPKNKLLKFVIGNFQDGSMSSLFGKTLNIGDNLTFLGPFGKFYIKERRAAIFIAFGSGIAPFLSILDEFRDFSFPFPISLIYSCKDESDFVYIDFLDDLSKKCTWFQYKKSLDSDVDNLNLLPIIDECWLNGGDVDFYISGTSKFVDKSKKDLLEKSILYKNIYLEKFSVGKKIT